MSRAIVRYWLFLVLLVSICVPDRAVAGDSELAVTLEKLEHLIDIDVSILEVEAVYSNDDGAFGFKVESLFESGSYDASESQLYYTWPVGGSFSGIVGARYLHLDDGDTISAMLGFSATTVLDIEVEFLTFFDDDFTEARFEVERAISLQPRLELVPKLGLGAFSNDVETALVEMRLIYAQTDRLSLYLGGAWFRLFRSGSDASELTALAGLSYAWH